MATVILFYIDCTQPRGVIDGIGYPAVVAVTARFGRYPLLGSAVFCTILIAVAHDYEALKAAPSMRTLVEITRGASCELAPKLKAGELEDDVRRRS